jgi:tripartite-type tricarboxylate transporter receptor subunit TctC
MVVQNKAGASGLLGAQTFLGSPADGHTIFTGIQPTLSMNMVVQDADFKLEDFQFINIEQRDYGSIVVHKDSPYQTLEDLIEDAKKRPGEVTMSVSAGAGTALFGYAFVDAFELDVNIVTFDSGGEQRTDLLGQHSDFAASGAYGDLSIKDQVRVLAVASEEKFPGWDAPPVNEVLAKYSDEKLPAIGDNRFVAVHKSFAEENPEAYNRIVETYKENFESDVYKEYVKSQDAETITNYLGPEESLKVIEELHAVVERYADLLKGSTQ